MRQTTYDQFTCHTEIDYQTHLKSNSQSFSIADIHTADTNRKLQKITFESKEYLEQEEAEEKEYIILQNSIRQQLSEQLKIEDLAKFDFSNFDNKIQLIFQWIIVVFYRTSSEMFEWKTFKEICIFEDRGKDLKNRIGLKNIIRMTKLEFELTKQLMVELLKTLFIIYEYSLYKDIVLNPKITITKMLFNLQVKFMTQFKQQQEHLKLVKKLCELRKN